MNLFYCCERNYFSIKLFGLVSESHKTVYVADFYEYGSFLCVDGPGKKAGKSYSNVKVCFTARDQDLLKRLISKIVKDEECYWAKISMSPKDGMYLGRCFFTSQSKACEFWAQYKTHPRLLVNIQDDDLTLPFRGQVVSWKDKPGDSVDF